MCWMYYVLPVVLVAAGIVSFDFVYGLWNLFKTKNIQNKTLGTETVKDNEDHENKALSPRTPVLELVMMKNLDIKSSPEESYNADVSEITDDVKDSSLIQFDTNNMDDYGPVKKTNSVKADDLDDTGINENSDISIDFVSFNNEDKEIVKNTKNVSVCSGYSSNENDVAKDMIDKLNTTPDTSGSTRYSQSNSESNWSYGNNDDSLKPKLSVEPTEDVGNNNCKLRNVVLARLGNKKKVKLSEYSTKKDSVENEQPTHNKTNESMHCSIEGDQISQDKCSTNKTRTENDKTSSNFFNSPDLAYKGSPCTLDKSNETYNSSLKLVTEYSGSDSLPSSIYCDDNSSDDIKYVEDFSDMSQNTSSISTVSDDDKMNEAFIELEL